MGRYEEDSYSSEGEGYGRDIEVASLGPLSLDYKPSKYKNDRGRESPARGRSRSRDVRDDGGVERGRSSSRGRSRERNEGPSRSRSRSVEKLEVERAPSQRSLGENVPSVYSNRSVTEDQADVVGRCVVDDIKELSTWRTSFTLSQILGGIPGTLRRLQCLCCCCHCHW